MRPSGSLLELERRHLRTVNLLAQGCTRIWVICSSVDRFFNSKSSVVKNTTRTHSQSPYMNRTQVSSVQF
jgi:hypothetical protein